MKRLLFHLWYDNEAREAVQFYSTVFSNCQLRHHYVLEDTPSGQVELIGFTLEDLSLETLNAGPFFNVILRFPWLYSVKTKQSVPNTCIS